MSVAKNAIFAIVFPVVVFTFDRVYALHVVLLTAITLSAGRFRRRWSR